MVMTLPFRWLTSASPSMLMTLSILAVTPSCSAEMMGSSLSRYSRAHPDTSLFTQCQLLGLWRTISAGGDRVHGRQQNLQFNRSASNLTGPSKSRSSRRKNVRTRRLCSRKADPHQKSTSLLGLVPAGISSFKQGVAEMQKDAQLTRMGLSIAARAWYTTFNQRGRRKQKGSDQVEIGAEVIGGEYSRTAILALLG